MSVKYKVCIRCMTYNHADFISSALDGFAMQQTTFPFVCVIMDDASTDGEQDVIKKYMFTNFDLNDDSCVRSEETNDYTMTFVRHKTNKNCYFAVYFLKYNHYSINKGKMGYINEWNDYAKYRAICEGDDYWIDPLKLQKQVEFMDCHKECSMVICNAIDIDYSSKSEFQQNPILTEVSRYVTKRELFREVHGLIPTASMCYRTACLQNEPSFFRLKHVGDRPLRMWYALCGEIYYFCEPMVVYRIGVPGSFGKRSNSNHEYAKRVCEEMIDFYNEYDRYTEYKYHDDVEYMKYREEYGYYIRAKDWKALTKCQFYKVKPLKERIRMRIRIWIHYVHPSIYRIYSLLKHKCNL